MEFTLIVVFDQSKKHVLLMQKNRGPYPGCWNCPGGHVERYELYEACAKRELLEETGIFRSKLDWLLSVDLPNSVTLSVYYTRLLEGEQFQQIEDEPLMWFDVKDLLNVTDNRLAGDGNLPYFIHYALQVLNKED